MIFTTDANTVMLLACQELTDGAKFMDVTGSENQGVGVTAGLLARQTGPASTIKSRAVDGLAGSPKFANSITLSSLWKDAIQNQCTLEMVFSPRRLINAQDYRTVYALGGSASKYLWMYYGKADTLLWFNWNNGGDKDFSVATGGLSESEWYYLAATKTVTSGTTTSNRINTWRVWILPLSGNWTDTPSTTATGLTNPSDSGACNNMMGSFNNGSNLLPGSFDVAGFRGSNVVRTTTELRTNFLSFKAGYAIDSAAPVVASTNPVNAAADIAASTPISVTFSKAINATTVTAPRFTVSGGVTGSLATVGATVTFTPDAPLTANTTYTVTVSGLIEDLVGQAVGSDTVFTFTTVTVDVSPPTVTIVSPPTSTRIGRNTPLVIDVTDNVALRRSMLIASFPPLGVEEVIHNGDAFGPNYEGNTREVISGGYRYTLLRKYGWPTRPTITPYPIDTSGNEAT